MPAPSHPLSLSLRRYAAEAASHSHAEWHQLVVARTGALEMEIDTRGGTVDGSALALVPAGTRHAFRPLGDGCFLVLDIAQEACDPGLDTLLEQARRSPFRVLRPEHIALCDFLAARTIAGDHDSALISAGADLLLRALVSAGTSTRLPAALAMALAFFRDHLAENVTVADAASAAGVSVSGLHKLFRGHLASTPRAWLTALRLQRARELLATPGARHGDLDRLAMRVGYRDSSTFARAFRTRFGISPARYRRDAAGA